MGQRRNDQHADLFEFYAGDPERADRIVFGRIPHTDCRSFLKGAGLAAMAAVVGATIPFHRNMPSGFIPEALAANPVRIEGKEGLTVLSHRPQTPRRRLICLTMK